MSLAQMGTSRGAYSYIKCIFALTSRSTAMLAPSLTNMALSLKLFCHLENAGEVFNFVRDDDGRWVAIDCGGATVDGV